VVYQEGSKKFKVLGRMVVKDGSRWREVELEEDGNWGPKFVFSIKSMSEIGRVDGPVAGCAGRSGKDSRLMYLPCINMGISIKKT
jgi:hypothetical protein